jgi:hypothetical protein
MHSIFAKKKVVDPEVEPEVEPDPEAVAQFWKWFNNADPEKELAITKKWREDNPDKC